MTPPPEPDSNRGCDPSPLLRPRLLEAMAVSIGERGYGATTVADVVRSARTSKRTFYHQFLCKEECFAEMVDTETRAVTARISAAVDPDAPWLDQIGQAVNTWVADIEARPALTLSRIRDVANLPAAQAVVLRRRTTAEVVAMMREITGNAGFRRAGIAPIDHVGSVLLSGGLRELAASAVERGGRIADITHHAIVGATRILRAGPANLATPAASHPAAVRPPTG